MCDILDVKRPSSGCVVDAYVLSWGVVRSDGGVRKLVVVSGLIKLDLLPYDVIGLCSAFWSLDSDNRCGGSAIRD